MDLIGQINYIDQGFVLMPNIFVLLNKKDHWKYNEKIFEIPRNKFVVGIDKIKLNGSNKDSLVFIFNDGVIKIF